MRQLVAALILVLVSTSAATADEAPCPPGLLPVKIYFINGILVSDVMAAAAGASAIEASLRERATTLDLFRGMPRECIVVTAAYNQSHGLLDDIDETSALLTDQEIISILRTKLGDQDLNPETAQKYRNLIQSLVEANYRDVEGLDSFVDDLFQPALNSGNRVVLVGHSEGTLFANAAYRKLTLNQQADVKLVAIATPSSFVEGAGPWTTAFEDDLINNFVTSLPSDLPIPIPDPLPSNASNNGKMPCGGGNGSVNPAKCHYLGYYVNGFETGPKITSDILMAILDRVDVQGSELRTRGSAQMKIFNVDDDLSVLLNGVEISSSGFGTDATLDLSHRLNHGSNRLDVRLFNSQSGWTYGLELVSDGSTLIRRECGNIGVAGCNGNSQARGLVYADAFEIVKSPENALPIARFRAATADREAFSGAELRVQSDIGTGEARITFSDLSVDLDGQIVSRVWTVQTQSAPLAVNNTTFTWGFTPGRYHVTLAVEDEIGGLAQAGIIVEVVDSSRGPSADFGMSEPRHGTARNGEFRLLAESVTGEARVTFTDTSTDPDGPEDIVSRVWTVDTQEEPLSIGDAQFTWGFQPGGPYNVTLTVTDRAGAVSLSTQSITVLPAETRIWPMTGGNAARQGLSPFSGPAHAPVAIWTFSTSAPVVGDIVVSGEGRIYFASDKLYALERDGSVYASASLPAVPGYTSPFMTSPAIDDENGFVYVGARSPQSGWRMFRFDKQLNNVAVVAESEANVDVMTGPTVSQGAVFFGTRAYWQSEAYAVGTVNWKSDACLGLNGGWYSAPTIGRDGSVYGICGTVLSGPVYAVKLVKLDRHTGAVVKELPTGRGPSELMIDGEGNLRSGYQIFTGVIFAGAFLRWDADLNPLSGGSPMDYTTSRVSLLPDGVSTVKIGYRWGNDSYLNFRGAVDWDLHLLSEHGPTVPSVDASGNIFVGSDSELLGVRSSDGSVLWRVPTDGPVTTQPAIAGHSVVYVGTSNGTVIAFVHFSMEL